MASLRSLLKSEDWMSVWIGLLISAMSLGLLMGADVLGWAVKTNVWLTFDQALQPVSEGYSGLGGGPSLILTFLFLLVLMTVAARGLELEGGNRGPVARVLAAAMGGGEAPSTCAHVIGTLRSMM